MEDISEIKFDLNAVEDVSRNLYDIPLTANNIVLSYGEIIKEIQCDDYNGLTFDQKYVALCILAFFHYVYGGFYARDEKVDFVIPDEFIDRLKEEAKLFFLKQEAPLHLESYSKWWNQHIIFTSNIVGITGSPGVGKTRVSKFITNNLVKIVERKFGKIINVIVGAPSNAAAIRIGKACEQDYYTSANISKSVPISIGFEGYNPKRPIFKQKSGIKPLDDANLLVADESSMDNEQYVTTIVNHFNRNKEEACIGIYDRNQLPDPQAKAFMDGKMCTVVSNEFRINLIVRQPLLDPKLVILEKLIDDIETVRARGYDGTVKYLRALQAKPSDSRIINGIKYGYELMPTNATPKNEQAFYQMVADTTHQFALKYFCSNAFRDDPDYARIICGRNATVTFGNEIAHKAIYGNERFKEGTALLGYNFNKVYPNTSGGYTAGLINSQTYSIVYASDLVEKSINCLEAGRGDYFLNMTYTLKGYCLLLSSKAIKAYSRAERDFIKITEDGKFISESCERLTRIFIVAEESYNDYMRKYLRFHRVEGTQHEDFTITPFYADNQLSVIPFGKYKKKNERMLKVLADEQYFYDQFLIFGHDLHFEPKISLLGTTTLDEHGYMIGTVHKNPVKALVDINGRAVPFTTSFTGTNLQKCLHYGYLCTVDKLQGGECSIILDFYDDSDFRRNSPFIYLKSKNVSLSRAKEFYYLRAASI